jgi:hypothetical protein
MRERIDSGSQRRNERLGLIAEAGRKICLVNRKSIHGGLRGEGRECFYFLKSVLEHRQKNLEVPMLGLVQKSAIIGVHEA